MPVSRNDMKKADFASSTFEKIKQDFDPAFSYIIFERTGPAGKTLLLEIFETLNRLDTPILDMKTFYDVSRGKMLLVAKFEAGRADGIMEEIIGAGLPKDVIFYGYGSSHSG